MQGIQIPREGKLQAEKGEEKRAAEYPDIREYLDAQVKINSEDKELQAEGYAQLDRYVKDCLAVKAKYPKPVDTDNVFF